MDKMKKFIVTTTINSPPLATFKFCKIAEEKNWTFVIVGDTKTPHDEYRKLEKDFKNIIYLMLFPPSCRLRIGDVHYNLFLIIVLI